MIDFHTHILPAIDDGAVSIDDSIAMAKSLAAFGYKVACCTPHCMKGYYDLTPQKVREATLMLQADLDNADVQLDLWPGMEYMLDECFAEYADDLMPIGDTRLVLCEAPHQAHPGIVLEGLELIVEKGFVPLVAHPERTQFFYEKLMAQGAGPREMGQLSAVSREPLTSSPKKRSFWSRLFSKKPPEPLSISPKPKETPESFANCLFHANLGSFTGFYGQDVQRKAYDLLKLGAYAALASDLHESRSSHQVLVHDKFAMNPYLKKLAEFDGSAAALFKVQGGNGESGEQGELF